MNLIDLSIRRPVFAWILMAALIVFGAIALNRMGVSQMPDVDFPIINVSVAYEGASPEVVEAELIDPMEEELLSIEGIKEMRSSARQGAGSISLEFNIDRNVDVALQEVSTALSQIRWPLGVDPAVIRKQNPDEDPILIISVYADKPLREMLNWMDLYLLDQLRFLPDVGEVDVAGFSTRNLRVWVDTNKLTKNYLTISDVAAAIDSQHKESAAGQFDYGDKELRVRWLGEAATVEEVGNIQILARGGARIHDKVIRIKDIARVEDGLTDIRAQAKYNNVQAVPLRIKKQRGSNEVEVAKRVKARLEQIQDQFPEGYKYRINVDHTVSTESTVNLTISKLFTAGIITILVCFFFLGSVSAAVNILFSIPTSIVGTFTILSFSGFTLNLFTLLALTLSISIVVDDAIMLLENIVRHYRMGKSPAKAASDGAKEVLPAAIAATLAVVAVFLPVAFMDGIIGKFFFQFGVTMCAAVLLSLLEAVTITPMRAAALLREEQKVNRFEEFLDHLFDKMAAKYQGLLEHTLRFKWSVVIGSMVFFAVSMVLISKVRQEFVPPQDQNLILLSGQTPPGTSLAVTAKKVEEIEKILKTNKNVESFMSLVGMGGNVTNMFMPVRLIDRDNRDDTHMQVMAQLRESFKSVQGIRLNMRDNSARNLASGRQNPLAINLRGPNLDVLYEKSQEFIKRMEEEKLAVDLDMDFRKGIPELLLQPDRLAMANRGVAVDSVGQVLAAGVGGLRQGRYTADGRRYDIRFKFEEDQIESPDDFKRLYVRNNVGNLIPLSDLVNIKQEDTIQTITRVNRQRAISVYGNLYPGQSQAVVLSRAEAIAKEILPTGYSYALEGASAGFSQSFASMTYALLIGILVAYMILAVQFNSFIHPVTVLIALPFSVTGALMALWGFNVSLNLFSFIGLIVLMGIAKKNSILLVEFTNQVRHRGEENTVAALLKACPVRLRPILMTSVATIAAALPLVYGGGFGSETRLPMGLTIIGGTLISTILTLFVVPALYLVLRPLERPHKADL